MLQKVRDNMSVDMSVARDKAYSRKSIVSIERHNERKNENYSNVDVMLEQAVNNVYFKKPEQSYLKTFV